MKPVNKWPAPHEHDVADEAEYLPLGQSGHVNPVEAE
jgi:hypothetical protein